MFEGWEMTQQLRALTTHPEDQDLILSTHIVAHSYLRYETLFCLLGNQACTWRTDIHAGRNPIDIITFLKKKAFWARHSGTQLIQKDPKFKANLGNLFLFFLLQQHLCRSGWPRTHYIAQAGLQLRFIYFCLLNTGIKGVLHYTWLAQITPYKRRS